MLVVLLILVASCAIHEENPSSAAVIPADERLVMVVGDSLSNGHGMERHEGWVALLQERLASRNEVFRVENFSMNGVTTFVGRSRIRAQLELYRPYIAIVALGGNDAILRMPAEKVRGNLESMLAELQAHDVRTLLAGVRIPDSYDEQYATGFADMYGELAGKYRVNLVPDLMEGVFGVERYMQPDGIHPNAQAQPRMLENVWPQLKSMLD